MESFKHVNANSVKEAVRLLRKNNGKAKLISGGTDLLGILKDRVLLDYPDTIINLKTIAGLDYIREDAQGLKIGALAKLTDIAGSTKIKKKYKVLADAAHAVASPNIRNLGTIGGNLCQDVRCWYYRYPYQIGGRMVCARKGGDQCFAVSGDNRYHAIMGGDPCFAVCPSDTAIALSALEAKVKIAGETGERVVPISEFYEDLGNVLGPEEILTEIQVPPPPGGSRQTFLKFRVREPIDFAIVSVASVLGFEDGACREASLALGAVAPTPVRAKEAEEAIKGKAIDDGAAKRAAEAALSGAQPLSKNAYKVQIAKTLLKRALLS